jgi:hypothetical protein
LCDSPASRGRKVSTTIAPWSACQASSVRCRATRDGGTSRSARKRTRQARWRRRPPRAETRRTWRRRRRSSAGTCRSDSGARAWPLARCPRHHPQRHRPVSMVVQRSHTRRCSDGMPIQSLPMKLCLRQRDRQQLCRKASLVGCCHGNAGMRPPLWGWLSAPGLTQSAWGMANAVDSCPVGSPSGDRIDVARSALHGPQMAHDA